MKTSFDCPRRHTDAECKGELEMAGDHYVCRFCRRMFSAQEVERFLAMGAIR